MVEKKINISDIKIGDYVGEAFLAKGGFAKTYKVRHIRTNEIYAMKVLKLKGELKDRMQKEVEILKKLNNPMIIKYRDSYETEDKMYVIMDLATGGTLEDLINSRKKSQNPFTLEEIVKILDQLIFGIKYLHNENVVHRDLKPENIFLTRDQFVRFGDFGLSAKLEHGKYTVIDWGTTKYIAPETIKQMPSKLEPDIWALGCILYELITLKQAFCEEKDYDTMEKIVKGEYDRTLLCGRNCPDSLADLVTSMLAVDRKQRPDIFQITSNLLMVQAQIKVMKSSEEKTARIGVKYMAKEELKQAEPDPESENKFVQHVSNYLTAHPELNEIAKSGKRFNYNDYNLESSDRLEVRGCVKTDRYTDYIGYWNTKTNQIEGKGFQYRSDKECFYEGYFKNGFLEGNGLFKYKNGNSRIMMEVEGVEQGVIKRGLITFSQGITYEGELLGDKLTGQGTFTYENKTVTGTFLDGISHGYTLEEHKSGYCFQGEYVNGKREGEAMESFPNGDMFSGHYMNDYRHGEGIYKYAYSANGNVEEGDFANGVFVRKKDVMVRMPTIVGGQIEGQATYTPGGGSGPMAPMNPGSGHVVRGGSGPLDHRNSGQALPIYAQMVAQGVATYPQGMNVAQGAVSASPQMGYPQPRYPYQQPRP